MSPEVNLPGVQPAKPRPFRRAVLRGFAVVLPPLLTVVIFVWVGRTVNDYVLGPVTFMAREVLVLAITDSQTINVKPGASPPAEKEFDGTAYHVLPANGSAGRRTYIPSHVYAKLDEQFADDEKMPAAAKAAYRRYVELYYLQPQFVIPVFTCVFVLLLYLLGKFLAAGIGHFLLRNFERGIERLPFVRNVYGSVKQVTDFVFSDSQVEYTRVIACEYPRTGIWSLGMVTGESMSDLAAAANEPVLSVLIPTSPLPMTGYTVTIKKSEALDLNISIDQALQFIVSCGVVVPPQQLYDALQQRKAENGDGQARATLPSSADEDSAKLDSTLPASGS
jgi:uncharacterized membrane protein